MECTTVNIILYPLWNYQFQPCLPTIEGGINILLNLNSNTLIRNISQVIMSKIGLEHLASHSEAYIQVPPSNSFVSSSSFPDPSINIGIIEAWIQCSPTIKILTIDKFDDFGVSRRMNTIDYNSLQSSINNLLISQDDLMNSFVKSITDGLYNFSFLSLQYSNLNLLNEIFEKESQPVRSNEDNPTSSKQTIENDKKTEDDKTSSEVNSINKTLSSLIKEEIINSPQSPPSTPSTTLDQVQSLPSLNNLLDNTFNTRRKIKYDPKIEIPILETWFETTKLPKADQLKKLADHLNSTSNRSPNDRITWKNLKYWFSYRRVKERRCKNY